MGPFSQRGRDVEGQQEKGRGGRKVVVVVGHILGKLL